MRRRQNILKDRALYAIAALGAGGVLLLSRVLAPSPAGSGTHEQLGLPPCTFNAVTGHGCPGCGLTTAFSYLAKGDVINALRANPVGVLMFIVVALVIPYSLYNIIYPAPFNRLLDSRWVMIMLTSFAVLMLVVWIVRLSLGQV